jgi:hypothetical protein
VIYGFYRGLEVEDHFPLNAMSHGPFRYIQDFFAPFYLFTKSVFKLDYVKSTDHFSNPELQLRSKAVVSLPFRSIRQLSFDLFFHEDRLEKFVIRENQKEPSEWLRSKDI